MEGFLSPQSKALCVDIMAGQDVFAMKELGVSDVIGVAQKASKPLVMAYKNKGSLIKPFDDDNFDFIFSAGIDR